MIQLSPSDLSILVIEPSQMQQKAIANELKKENINSIGFASDLTEARTYLASHHPDLIASAMYFKDGDAIDFVRELKDESSTSDISFMLISSEHKKEQLEAFRQSGVVAILPKPFTSEHLGTAINATIDLIEYEELQLDYFDVKSIRVLLVDDSAFARKFVRRVLVNLGLEQITEVADGSEAIEILQDQMFDLVITDYNMPEVNGRELTEYIRNESQQSHIPVLMVSSEANETHLANIAQSGVNAMCDKPFEPSNVRRILFGLLEGDAD
jgi:two-component system chemotaxis response regulator CheY